MKQSGRNWNSLLHKLFEKHIFIQSQVDACVYIREDDDNKILIVMWVDDIVIAASSIKLMNEAKELLKENFKMKDLGPISWFLGIQFKQNSDGI